MMPLNNVTLLACGSWRHENHNGERVISTITPHILERYAANAACPIIYGHGGHQCGQLVRTYVEGNRLLADLELDNGALTAISWNWLTSISIETHRGRLSAVALIDAAVKVGCGPCQGALCRAFADQYARAA